ncbi:MAG: phosphate signaling complex protein PhoU [Alphaproteobacteria bacterium]|nr:phosphate signaling complex protein PhoU [Alphaproteobacteria bacterium]
MSDEHIVKSFGEELERIDQLIVEMGGLAETQLASAIRALVRRDAELANDVVDGDARIDALESEVNERIIRLLALRQPMAGDLRVAIAALKISNELERIGDYAKNVAKRTVVLVQSPAMPATLAISRMGTLVQGMIKSVLDAYVARDALAAEDVRLADQEVDQLHTSMFRELLTYMMEDPRNITPCTHLLFIAKNIERVGDHTTNIAENVHFLVRGEDPDGARPKRDRSSSTSVNPADSAPTTGISGDQ